MNTLSVILLQDAAGGGAGLMNILFIIVFALALLLRLVEGSLNGVELLLEVGLSLCSLLGCHVILESCLVLFLVGIDNLIELLLREGLVLKLLLEAECFEDGHEFFLEIHRKQF